MQTKAGFGYQQKANSVGETARQILNTQLLLIEVNAGRAIRLRGTKAVHDLRVAIRRFRVALRVFRDLMPLPVVKRLRQRFLSLNRRLGPIRDAQVWRSTLARTFGRKRTPLPMDLNHCVQAAEAACAQYVQTLDQVLKEVPFKTASECCRQLRCDLPNRPFLAGKLHRAYKRLCLSGISFADAKVEEVHALRRHCRRVRYLSEFAEPVLGKPIHTLTRHLKRTSTALGERHDAEVQTRMLNALKNPPEDILARVARRKREAQHDFDKAWRQLTAPHFRRRVMAELQAAKKAGT